MEKNLVLYSGEYGNNAPSSQQAIYKLHLTDKTLCLSVAKPVWLNNGHTVAVGGCLQDPKADNRRGEGLNAFDK